MKKNRTRKQVRELWTGHIQIECPVEVLEFAGRTPALLLVNIYNAACFRSAHAKADYRIRFKVRTDSLVRKLNTSERTIRSAIRTLKRHKLIQWERNKNHFTKRWETAQVTLPQIAQPGRADLLTANGVRRNGTIVVPKDCLTALNEMGKACESATYLAVLSLGTVNQSEQFKASRRYVRKVSRLKSRASFDAGLQYCRRKKLITLRGETWTLNDPKTGKPSQRPPLRSPMPIDLDTVTAAGWKRVVASLPALGSAYLTDTEGWTKTSTARACPFCHQFGKFSINYEEACFNCFGCGRKGKLGLLVKSLLDVEKMRDAAQYIKAILETKEEIAAVEV